MGLSFYTFQTIGFWVDNLRSPSPRPTFLDYLNFSSFFPQIVAGPIEKRENLLPQIEKIRFRIHPENIDAALRWIILGLAYKMVVADNLGLLPEKFQINPSNAFHVWFESLTFAMRIYFDFAGYSFIAVGLGLIFGVHLTLNFCCPFWSANLRDFWRSWHITLGAWLRDYIYLPLGGRKHGNWIINTLIVFFVSGIWHGAGWGFIIWGLLHGIGVAVCTSPTATHKLPWPVRWITTFLYTTAAWLFFMESNPSLLREKDLALINPLSYGLEQIKGIPNVFSAPIDALTLALILGIAFIALLAEGLGLRKNREPYHFGRARIVSALLVFLIVFLAPMEESRFIYFNF
jgi:D-alanyl-lipoteichoic acid acyltransferase DltB (MBOAT superfamily)